MIKIDTEITLKIKRGDLYSLRNACIDASNYRQKLKETAEIYKKLAKEITDLIEKY